MPTIVPKTVKFNDNCVLGATNYSGDWHGTINNPFPDDYYSGYGNVWKISPQIIQTLRTLPNDPDRVDVYNPPYKVTQNSIDFGTHSKYCAYEVSLNVKNVFTIFTVASHQKGDYKLQTFMWSAKRPNTIGFISGGNLFYGRGETPSLTFNRKCKLICKNGEPAFEIDGAVDGTDTVVSINRTNVVFSNDRCSTFDTIFANDSFVYTNDVPDPDPEPLPPPPPPGPFEPGGDSKPGGGGGTFDDTSTPVEIPKPPSISAAQTGLISLFTPTLGQLNSLASFLWSDLFDLNTWKKVFSEPMDAILGLSILPVKLPGGAVKEVTLGNVNTGVSMAAVTSQYVTVDCGTLDLEEYWKAYLDYAPYTKVEIYLPYIGIHALDTDDVMGKKLQVSYNIDVLTGACTAFVKAGDSVLYSYVGTCSVQIPVTGSNYNAMLHGVITSAAAIGTMALTGGATAPMLATTAASAAVNAVQKPTVEKSGSLSGSGGIMGIQKPYLIITRPKQAKPKNQNIYTGYPAYTTQKLGDLKGYTEVEQIHLENIPATAGELAEIETLLKGGVLL